MCDRVVSGLDGSMAMVLDKPPKVKVKMIVHLLIGILLVSLYGCITTQEIKETQYGVYREECTEYLSPFFLMPAIFGSAWIKGECKQFPHDVVFTQNK